MVSHTVKRLFIDQARLRSGWRVLSYIIASRLALVAISIALGITLSFIFFAQSTPPDEIGGRVFGFFTSVPGLLLAQIVQVPITVALVFLWRRGVDKRSFQSLGLQRAPGWRSEFWLGVALAAAAWAVIFAGALATGAVSIFALRPDFGQILLGLLAGLVGNLLVGFNEELDARGYVLQNLEEGVGLPLAVAISALYFGALHLVNPGANLGTLIGTTLFGIVAALAYWATGRLWMPIGLHAAWNFFEGPVLGFLVSGLDLGGIFELRVSGPEWLTGGSFGPEAGALTIVPQLILIPFIYFLGWRKKARR